MPLSAHKSKIFFLLYVLLPGFYLNAQVKYSADSSYVTLLSNAARANQEGFSINPLDTTLNHFQNYFPRNTNGNYGLASAPLYLNYKSQPLGFRLYHAPYDNDMISEDQVNFFQTKGPFASLTGVAGSKQEQAFKMLFSHTFKNKLNLTLVFNRYSGLGFYTRQQTFTNNFYTSSNYSSKNNRFGYYAYFLFNKVKHSENGGIKDDSLFLEDVSVTKNLLPINLTNARREVRYSTINFNPWFRLNKRQDSSALLSHIIDYEITYRGNYTKYYDSGIATDSFYNFIYLDPNLTNDSTHWRKLDNAFNYTLKLNPLHLSAKLGYRHEYNQVHQHYDSVFQHQLVNAGLFYAYRNAALSVRSSYIFSGPSQNDYNLEFIGSYKGPLRAFSSISHPLSYIIKLKALAEKRHPDFIYNTWYTNHFAWTNQFSPEDKSQAQLSFATTDNRLEAGILVQNISNFLYFDDQAMPQQAGVTIQNLVAFVKKDVLLFKHLGIDVAYNYQYSSYKAIVSVPEHIVAGALYYQGNLFRKALQLQVGFNAQYFSSFNGYAYMPATNQYYVQTTETVGNYPFVDFFLNARIRPVRFFLKIDHVTQGFLGHNYSLTPGYLQNDRAFKFGINWIFFD